jgi:hypothetical protein
MAMRISQRMAAIHALRRLRWSGFKRESTAGEHRLRAKSKVNH